MENEKNTNDEISLIDLFTVFIRYRKLIIFGTLLLSFIAILGLFVIQKDSKTETYSVEFTIPFLINKNYINGLIDYDFANDSILKFKNLNAVANINKECNMFNYNFTEQPFNELQYNKFIYDMLQNKVYDVKLNSTKSAVIVTVKTFSVEESEKFVSNLVNKINEEYYDFLLPLVTNKLDVLNEVLDNRLNTNINPVMNENELLKEQLGLQTILKDDIEVFDGVKTSLVLKQNPKSNKKLYLLIVIGSFCCFVLLAFLLNAIKNIKSDEKASEIIKSAWESGKKLIP